MTSRAERLRLRHRLDIALRGAGLLERKLHVLRTELERLRRDEEAATRRWHEQLRQAETWLLRAQLLGGEHALAEAAAGMSPAHLTVGWTATLGVRHPQAAPCAVPPRAESAAPARNAALIRAEAAHRAALQAAADHAALRAATRLVDAEAAATRQRVRALRQHWIPRLREALAATDLALEQAEHEDAVRRRWAASRGHAGAP
jgi:V/A-type H+-transporting ATPase subunit D